MPWHKPDTGYKRSKPSMISSLIVCKWVKVGCPRTKTFWFKLVKFFVQVISNFIYRKRSIFIIYNIENSIVNWPVIRVVYSTIKISYMVLLLWVQRGINVILNQVQKLKTSIARFCKCGFELPIAKIQQALELSILT